MELTRRDVLAALAAGGAAAGAGVSLSSGPGEGPVGDHEIDTLVAVARVVYPTEVAGVESFVRQYSVERARDRPEYAAGVADAVAVLDEYSRTWSDADFADLDTERADRTLSGFEVDTADPDPDGSDRERVRYYLVNELLYALFSTPTGGRLAGIENPQGHPGGSASYQRGPE
ncbi:gluconate 2-dehydrogenase subunit 3 family protein [Halobacterium jilantaiense]|uniref:Tat (Twin-arginine translocation) pathway signal sequence n=1 Tax=Halobacterium jilantaiense TaxID=355548 RepID=A0A1I0MVV2_9EURY|nr:gluconate 2-dehydrogenase subunit 3 family protein [Halobacterium jilantaiense]SEV92176.1 Tat (twin-arginine translocation) pathway signal sequence [Halobacterium jilantaiense]